MHNTEQAYPAHLMSGYTPHSHIGGHSQLPPSHGIMLSAYQQQQQYHEYLTQHQQLLSQLPSTAYSQSSIPSSISQQHINPQPVLYQSHHHHYPYHHQQQQQPHHQHTTQSVPPLPQQQPLHQPQYQYQQQISHLQQQQQQQQQPQPQSQQPFQHPHLHTQRPRYDSPQVHFAPQDYDTQPIHTPQVFVRSNPSLPLPPPAPAPPVAVVSGPSDSDTLSEQLIEDIVKASLSSKRLDLSQKVLSALDTILFLNDALHRHKSHWDLLEVNLTSCGLTTQGLSLLIPILADIPTLQIVILRNNKLSKDCGSILAKLFYGSASLKLLDVSNNLLGDVGIAGLASAFSESSQQQYQHQPSYAAPYQTQLLKAPSLNSLSYLDLSRNDFGDAGVLALCRALLQFFKRSAAVVSSLHSTSSMTAMQQSTSTVYNNSAAMTSNHSSSSLSLRTLKLNHSKITDKGMQCLIQLLESNTTSSTQAQAHTTISSIHKSSEYSFPLEELSLEQCHSLSATGLSMLFASAASPLSSCSISLKKLSLSLCAGLSLDVLKHLETALRNGNHALRQLEVLHLEFSVEAARECVAQSQRSLRHEAQRSIGSHTNTIVPRSLSEILFLISDCFVTTSRQSSTKSMSKSPSNSFSRQSHDHRDVNAFANMRLPLTLSPSQRKKLLTFGDDNNTVATSVTRSSVSVQHLFLGSLPRVIFECCCDAMDKGDVDLYNDCFHSLEAINNCAEVYSLPCMTNVQSWVRGKVFNNLSFVIDTGDSKRKSSGQYSQNDQGSNTTSVSMNGGGLSSLSTTKGNSIFNSMMSTLNENHLALTGTAAGNYNDSVTTQTPTPVTATATAVATPYSAISNMQATNTHVTTSTVNPGPNQLRSSVSSIMQQQQQQQGTRLAATLDHRSNAFDVQYMGSSDVALNVQNNSFSNRVTLTPNISSHSHLQQPTPLPHQPFTASTPNAFAEGPGGNVYDQHFNSNQNNGQLTNGMSTSFPTAGSNATSASSFLYPSTGAAAATSTLGKYFTAEEQRQLQLPTSLSGPSALSFSTTTMLNAPDVMFQQPQSQPQSQPQQPDQRQSNQQQSAFRNLSEEMAKLALPNSNVASLSSSSLSHRLTASSHWASSKFTAVPFSAEPSSSPATALVSDKAREALEQLERRKRAQEERRLLQSQPLLPTSRPVSGLPATALVRKEAPPPTIQKEIGGNASSIFPTTEVGIVDESSLLHNDTSQMSTRIIRTPSIPFKALHAATATNATETPLPQSEDTSSIQMTKSKNLSPNSLRIAQAMLQHNQNVEREREMMYMRLMASPITAVHKTMSPAAETESVSNVDSEFTERERSGSFLTESEGQPRRRSLRETLDSDRQDDQMRRMMSLMEKIEQRQSQLSASLSSIQQQSQPQAQHKTVQSPLTQLFPAAEAAAAGVEASSASVSSSSATRSSASLEAIVKLDAKLKAETLEVMHRLSALSTTPASLAAYTSASSSQKPLAPRFPFPSQVADLHTETRDVNVAMEFPLSTAVNDVEPSAATNTSLATPSAAFATSIDDINSEHDNTTTTAAITHIVDHKESPKTTPEADEGPVASAAPSTTSVVETLQMLLQDLPKSASKGGSMPPTPQHTTGDAFFEDLNGSLSFFQRIPTNRSLSQAFDEHNGSSREVAVKETTRDIVGELTAAVEPITASIKAAPPSVSNATTATGSARDQDPQARVSQSTTRTLTLPTATPLSAATSRSQSPALNRPRPSPIITSNFDTHDPHCHRRHSTDSLAQHRQTTLQPHYAQNTSKQSSKPTHGYLKLTASRLKNIRRKVETTSG